MAGRSGPAGTPGPRRLPAPEVRDCGAAAAPLGCVGGAASCGRTPRAGRRRCGWKPGVVPRGAGMQARPHQGRTRDVLRKLAPVTSSLTGTRLGPVSVGQRKKPRYQGRKYAFQGGLCAFRNRLKSKAAVLEEGRSSRQAAGPVQHRPSHTNTSLWPHQQGPG